MSARDGPRKRVAYIMSRFPKLTETFVLYEMLAVEAAGIAVEIFPLLRNRQPVAHPEAEDWVRRAHFHPFLSLPILRSQLHFLRRQPRTYLRLVSEVLRKTWGSANFFFGALGIFPKAVRFAHEMQRTGVSHVHAHFATHPALAAFMIHRLTGIPYSFTAHGSDLHVERRMLETKIMAAAFAVTVSEYNRHIMVEECGGRFGERIHVIHCGIDPDVFRPGLARAEGGPCRIVCVASFEEVKGHRYLLEACSLLRERGVQFRCDLVGDGPLRREIAALIVRNSLDEHVWVLGAQPRPEVLRLLAAADAAVLASYPTPQGKREGIPVSLMEAMAAGLPVVASAISGIPELVTSGVSGVLVPPADPHALADALQRLAEDPELRLNMGHAARDAVRRDFNLHSSARTLAALFRGTARPRGASVVPV